MCTEGMVRIAILVLAMVATLPAAQRQQITNHMAGSVWEPPRHSMCTPDASTQKFNWQCTGDLQYSEELEGRAVSSTCLVAWLIKYFSFSTVFLVMLGTPR